jgi:hypothetical protein
VLKAENIVLGARLFRPIRLKGEKITKSNPYWSTLGGKSLPRVVVVDTTGKKVGGQEGDAVCSCHLIKEMKKATDKTYKADIERVVKESRELLDEMDRIEAKQKQLAEQKKDARPGKEKEIAEEERKLAAQMKDVQEREAALLKKVQEDRKVAKG